MVVGRGEEAGDRGRKQEEWGEDCWEEDCWEEGQLHNKTIPRPCS
jgi:hypothetical protein